MKSKLLIAAFIVTLICSAFSTALTMAKCPTCKGTGEVACPDCDGTGEITIEEGEPCTYCLGSGTLEPTLSLRSTGHWLEDGKMMFSVSYRNDEDVTVHGKVTAEVEAQSKTYKGSSSDTTFPPNEEVQVNFAIEGISSTDYSYLQGRQFLSPTITLEANAITCPHCDGTGLAPSTMDCPTCKGTGFIECPTCDGTGVEAGEQNADFDIGGAVYGATAVVVIAGVAVAAFVVMKKRSVKESDLRKLPATEFQNWVLKKMGGKPSSQGDARMGIDGYTIDGQPIAIKQTDNIDRTVVENFAAAMGRRNAKNGTIVAFSFGTDAVRGRVRAKMSYGLDIQMVTARDLTENRNTML